MPTLPLPRRWLQPIRRVHEGGPTSEGGVGNGKGGGHRRGQRGVGVAWTQSHRCPPPPPPNWAAAPWAARPAWPVRGSALWTTAAFSSAADGPNPSGARARARWGGKGKKQVHPRARSNAEFRPSENSSAAGLAFGD